MRIAIVLLCIIGLSLTADAQRKKSWRKLAREAEDFQEERKLQLAAQYYRSAYAQKEDKKELIYNAGVCYFQIRDYASAVECLEPVKEMNGKFGKPGYKYALALKQMGRYKEAKKAFETFLRSYNGSDYRELQEIIEVEIQGCNFAMNAEKSVDPDVELKHLDQRINSDKTEFAPIPFDGPDNNPVLYFSSIKDGPAKIYRTEKKNGQWERPSVPSIFVGKIEKPHFGNGSFTPDGARFYFTECTLQGGATPVCAIYLMESKEGVWQKPIRLPDYINVESANNTHPFVTVIDDKEILYFSSDREGGKGGMDIWYCSKTVNSRGNNYTLPRNLGSNINTPGDEVTPHYDADKGYLYFSSSGRVSAGGLDIFQAKGEKSNWEVPTNLGFPLNSSADDLYYTLSESHGGGYLVSNRILESEKVSTTNDDIFYFGRKSIEVKITGTIYDLNEGSADMPVEDVRMRVFEKIDASEELLINKMLATGEYEYVLQPRKKYIIEFSKDGYDVETFQVDANEFSKSEVVRNDIGLSVPLEMEKGSVLHQLYPPADCRCADRSACLIFPSIPIDPNTGEPYPEGTAEYDAYYQARAIAERSEDEQSVCYDENDVMQPFKPIDDTPSFPEETASSEGDTDIPTGMPIKNFENEPSLYEAEADNVVYRIQVAAVRNFRESSYRALTNRGRFVFEDIEGGLRRVMIVPDAFNEDSTEGYKSKGAALDELIYIMNNTRFARAFVIRYENGERVGEGFRGLEAEPAE